MKRKEIKNTNRRNEEICKTGKREENERNVHTQTEEKAPNVLICKPSHHVAISPFRSLSPRPSIVSP